MKLSLAISLLSLSLAGAQPFPNCEKDSYYSSLNDNNVAGWSRGQVHDLIQSTHKGITTQSGEKRGENDVWEALMALDAGAGDATVKLVYSNEQVPKIPFAGNEWNKEWLWPLTRGIDAEGLDSVDLHNIRPIDLNPTKIVRRNKYFGECGILNHGGDCETPAQGGASTTCSCNRAYQPPTNVRGEIARTLMYMDLRYDGTEPNTLNLTLTDCPFNPPQDMAYKSIMLKWHEEYQPSDFELARNLNVCGNFQGNRNPFVDYPELAQSFFGDPLPVPTDQGREIYEACEEIPTSQPTFEPNDCEMIEIGDIIFFYLLSDDPDEVAMFLFGDLPGGMDVYLTDNAWNGQKFTNDEGIIKLTTPEDGIPAGTWFGVGKGIPRGTEWEAFEGSFSLSNQGEQVFLYCFGNTGNVRPLAAISYTGEAFDEPNLPEYKFNQSALPEGLEDGTVVLPKHEDNWIYNGPNNLEKDELRYAMRNTTLYWKGSSVDRPSLSSPGRPGGGSGASSLDMLWSTVAVFAVLTFLT